MSESEADIREGGCLCGAVRFRADVRQHDFNACSCDACRRWGAGPFMAVSCADAEFTGTVTRYRSSDWAERGFCAACGGHLFFRVLPDGAYEISVGALDDQSGLTVTGEIFCDRNPGTYAFAGLTTRMSEEECLARWAKTTD